MPRPLSPVFGSLLLLYQSTLKPARLGHFSPALPHLLLSREARSPGSSLLPGVTVTLPGLLPELLVLSNTLRVASRKTWGREKPDLGGCVSTTPNRWVRSFLPCPPCSLNTSWYCRLSRAALSAASLEGDPGPESHTPRNDSRFFTLLVVGGPGGGS